MTKSDAAEICESLVPLIQAIATDRATAGRLWHPSFDAEALGDAKVSIRPAARRGEGGRLATREVDIEIGINQRFGEPANPTADPYNPIEQIDGLDLLAEEIFDAFLPEGSLRDRVICGYTPQRVRQPTTIDNDTADQYRQFLTVLIVTYDLKD